MSKIFTADDGEQRTLSMPALWNKPLLFGITRWFDTDEAPALLPSKSTLLASPPKDAMCCFTQERAARWSCIPQLPVDPDASRSVADPRNPKAFIRYALLQSRYVVHDVGYVMRYARYVRRRGGVVSTRIRVCVRTDSVLAYRQTTYQHCALS